MKKLAASALLAVLLIAHPSSHAQGNGKREFGGLTLGVGLSLTHDLGKNDRVESASVVNGIVRVTNEKNDVTRIMLESHYFFVPQKEFWLNSSVKANEWGWGPFVAIQSGSNEIVEAIAFGVMWGFKRSGTDNSSWNIGFGAVVDPSTKVLGDGFVPNQPPPAGETEVRYKEKSQWGLLIISSFSF
jgi:hypothetical protein